MRVALERAQPFMAGMAELDHNRLETPEGRRGRMLPSFHIRTTAMPVEAPTIMAATSPPPSSPLSSAGGCLGVTARTWRSAGSPPYQRRSGRKPPTYH